MNNQVSDLSKGELIALTRAIDLWEELLVTLSEVEARPKDDVLHVESEIQPGYLGWIGYNDNGKLTFQPATKEAADVGNNFGPASGGGADAGPKS